MRYAITLCAFLVAVPVVAEAVGPVVTPAACSVTWDAPQVNVDGSNLADLKEYRVFVANDAVTVAAMTTPTATLPAPAQDPAVGATATWACGSLPPAQYYVQAEAVDLAGNRSARPVPFPFVVQTGAPLPDTVAPDRPRNLRMP